MPALGTALLLMEKVALMPLSLFPVEHLPVVCQKDCFSYGPPETTQFMNNNHTSEIFETT